MIDIDEIARQGYLFAEAGGKGIPSIDVTDDMTLMAFNAGISNYNVRNDKEVPRYKPTSLKLNKAELDKNPYPANHVQVQQASI